MMADAEDNFTNSSDYSDYAGRYGRKDYPLVTLYLAVPLWLITSLAIVISASIVLLAIKRSKRNTITLHFFFVANLMITDIGVAVICNGMSCVEHNTDHSRSHEGRHRLQGCSCYHLPH